MKSKIFESIEFERDDQFKKDAFSKDLTALSQLGRNGIDLLIKGIGDNLRNKTGFDKDKFFHELSEKLSLPIATIRNAFNIAIYFLQSSYKDKVLIEDNPKNVSDDLIEGQILNKKDKDIFEYFLQEIFNITTSVLLVRNGQRQALSKACALFNGLTFGVAFRAIYKNEYVYGFPNPNYAAECIGFTPVISATLHLEQSKQKYVDFEIEPHDLDFLIDALNAAKTELKAAEQYLELK